MAFFRRLRTALKIKPQMAVIVAIKWADGEQRALNDYKRDRERRSIFLCADRLAHDACMINYGACGQSAGFPFCFGECHKTVLDGGKKMSETG